MFHLLLGPLLPGSRGVRLVELVAMADQVSLASSLLDASAHPPTYASGAITQLVRQVGGLRRKLESRIARAGLHSIDPRLISEAASELTEVVRLVKRVVRCREWLRLDATPEVRDLEVLGIRGVQLVARTARTLGISAGWLGPGIAQPMKAEADELYDQGVAAVLNDRLDPLEVLRRKALYDLLLGVVIGSDNALEALQTASPQ